nr:MAG TPA: hypothetical protein [Bacteriophage sp.]
MERYLCYIHSGIGLDRQYCIYTPCAYKAATELGRRERGELVAVRTPYGRIMSRVVYSTETGDYYFIQHKPDPLEKGASRG